MERKFELFIPIPVRLLSADCVYNSTYISWQEAPFTQLSLDMFLVHVSSSHPFRLRKTSDLPPTSRGSCTILYGILYPAFSYTMTLLNSLNYSV